LCKEKVKVLGRQVKVVVKEVIMKEEQLGWSSRKQWEFVA
jgi:hypothetical protein